VRFHICFAPGVRVVDGRYSSLRNCPSSTYQPISFSTLAPLPAYVHFFAEAVIMLRIQPVRSEKDLMSVKQLFEAYVKSLGIDLAFQDYATEYSGLPGKYAPPTGDLLLAVDGAKNEPLGCVALRPLPSGGTKCCEMKRLYIRPEGRGTGAGKALALEILEVAKELGYEEVKLDTLASMTAARKLYERLGFTGCQPYYHNPIAETVFMAKDLR
jgi:putative acetyltransferase